MFVASAKLTAIRRTRIGAMMLGNFLAFLAEDAVRIEPFNQLLKASCIVWVLALKLDQRISAVRDARPDWVIAIHHAHTDDGIRCRYIRQGDTYPN